MANIQPYVDQIRQARYGRDVRESIASGIEAMNTESEEAYNQAITSQTSCVNLAGQAQASATNSANSAQSALNSRNEAEQIVSNVRAYDESARNSAVAALASANAAKESETNAKTSETNSNTSALASQTSASQSAASATSAKTSETNAAQSQQSALSSANSAQASASAASSSQTAAAQSATQAGVSEQNAKNWAEQAKSIANIDIATTSKVGIVKPDGVTINVDQFGTISTNITEHTDKKINSNNGAHGVRVINGDMQYWDETAQTWKDALDADGIAYDENMSIKEKIDDHDDSLVTAEGGVHGLRYYDSELSCKEGNDWKKIPTGHDLVKTEADLNALTQTGDKVVEAYLMKTIVEDLKKGRSYLHIHTNEPLFIGLTVTAEAGSESVSDTIDENGDCTLTVYSVGVEFYVYVEYGGKTYGSKINVPYYSSYNVPLAMDSAIIGIMTASSELYGKAVKVSLDGDTYSEPGTINSSGACDITVFKLGTYTVECTDATIGSHVPKMKVDVTKFIERYPVTLTYNYATIRVKTSETELLGKEVTVKGTKTYTGTFPSTMEGGVASVEIEVFEKETYTVTCEDAEKTVQVLNYGITSDVELSLKLWLVKNGVWQTAKVGDYYLNNMKYTEDVDKIKLQRTTTNGCLAEKNKINFDGTNYTKFVVDYSNVNSPMVVLLELRNTQISDSATALKYSKSVAGVTSGSVELDITGTTGQHYLTIGNSFATTEWYLHNAYLTK